MVKEFFHVHEYHDCDEDSLLTAYTSSCAVSIKDPDNKALVHFLFLYEKKFLAFSRQISMLFGALQENAQDSSSKAKAFIVGRQNLNKLCERVIGESIYYNALINSKYNHSCRVPYPSSFTYEHQESVPLKMGEANDLYRIALNIQNALKSIDLIRMKNQSAFDYGRSLVSLTLAMNTNELISDAKKALQKGEILTWIGISATIISLVFGIISVL